LKPSQENREINHNSELSENEIKRANNESRKSMYESKNQFKALNSETSHQHRNFGILFNFFFMKKLSLFFIFVEKGFYLRHNFY
jgi:hypothetical protein